MFEPDALVIGAIGAYVVGLSKTGLPGAGVLAIPLFATVFEGRLIPGATLPILLVADLFAVGWYRHHCRWDVLRPLATWIGAGFLAGIAFFVAVGSATRSLEVGLGAIVLVIVAIQLRRLFRATPPAPASRRSAAVYGTSGGFTTFVANAAGPIVNTYLAGLGLPKLEHVGTSAWLYFAVNLAKIPLYVTLGELTTGGRFFTADTLTYGALMIPAIVVGVYSGRILFRYLPQRAFLTVVLVLSGVGAARLIA